MLMATLSVKQIADNLITYFADWSGDPRQDFTEGTDVKARYLFSDAAWADMADGLSQLDWMVTLKVRLKQGEMNTVPRIGQLATLIWGYANKSKKKTAAKKIAKPKKKIKKAGARAVAGKNRVIRAKPRKKTPKKMATKPTKPKGKRQSRA